MSKDALKFIDDRLRPFDRKLVSASMEDVLKAVAWKTMPGAYCSCGERVLATRAKTTTRTVRRSLKKAESLKLIRREPSCRGVDGGRGRAYDTILIVGFNDVAWTNQADKLSRRNSKQLTGHLDRTYRPNGADQPDIETRAYKEGINSTNSQSPLLPKSAPTPNQSAMIQRVETLMANLAGSMDEKLRASLSRLDQNVRKRSGSSP